MRSVGSPIRPITAGDTGDGAAAFAVTRFPNGLLALLRLDLEAEGAEWTQVACSTSRETFEGSVYRWTGVAWGRVAS